MTLIASTLNYGKPFILGDLLISSPHAQKSIQLPTNTIDVTPHLATNTSFATDLYQKLYIINSHVAVALAGDVFAMKKFLQELTIRCSYYSPDSFDSELFNKFLTDFDIDCNFQNSAYLLFIMHPQGESISVYKKWHPIDFWEQAASETFEEVVACGSGQQDFLNQITVPHAFDATAHHGSIWRAITANCTLIAKLLTLERFYLPTLQKNWGGGFEAICFDNGSFIKIDEIAYVIHSAVIDELGNIDFPVPELIQYYKYHKGTLFIVAIEIHHWTRQDTVHEIVLGTNQFRVDIFPVRRLDMLDELAFDLPADFSFFTPRLALGFAIIAKDKGVLPISQFVENNVMRVRYEDRKYLDLVIQKDMLQTVTDNATAAFKRSIGN